MSEGNIHCDFVFPCPPILLYETTLLISCNAVSGGVVSWYCICSGKASFYDSYRLLNSQLEVRMIAPLAQ